jgi:hypothetical protein
MSYTAQPKDHQRVANLYGRAVGKPYDKVIQLAQNMANSITDPTKACRRGDAAWHFVWHGMPANLYEEVARIFYERAINLGSSVASDQWAGKLGSTRPGEVVTPARAGTPSATNNPGKRKIQL